MRSWTQRRVSARRSRHHPGERGSAVIEFPILVGLLLIPFGMLILSVPTWIERQTAARDAAAESARYLVLAGPEGLDDATQIVHEIEAGYGLPDGSLELEMPGAFVAGQPLSVTVRVVIPAADIPLLGSFGDTTWTATHIERYPDYGRTN